MGELPATGAQGAAAGWLLTTAMAATYAEGACAIVRVLDRSTRG